METDPCPPSPSAPTRGWLSARGWRTFRPGHCGHVPARGPGLALPAPWPPGHPPAAPREGSGRPEPQDPASLSPLAKPPPPAGRNGDSTHGLAIPSRGAILTRGPRGSLRPGNGLCVGALHSRACGTLGTDRAGGTLSAWFSFLPLQALLGTKRRGYRLGRGHTRSPASWAGPGITQQGGTDKTGAGDRQGNMLVDAHGAGMWCQDARRPLHPPLCSGWGASPAVDTQCCWRPWVQGGTEDGQEPQNSVRVPGEQSRGSACSGVPVVTSPLSGRPQGSTRPRPTWRLCSSWGGSEL